MFKAFIRITVIFWQEFKRDNISLRACALTFTIVLSLVPTLALGTAVLKGLGAGDQIRQVAYRFIDNIENSTLPLNQMLPPEDPASSKKTTPDTIPTSEDALVNHLRKAADQIFDYVERTDFATLGAFGVVGLVFSVLSVLGSIEKSMNVIWQAKSGRPFGRKLMDYLALMILLPLSVNLALATETTLQNQALFKMFNDLLPIAWLTSFLLNIMPLILVTCTFSVLYRFLPNTKVRVLPAFAGGIIGGTSWLFTQTLYLKLQIGVARYNAIYGSFATLPLFLLWLYIGWLIFLAGAEIAFACQVWRTYFIQKVHMSPQSRLSLACRILDFILSSYDEGKTISSAELSEELDCSLDEADEVAQILADGGVLREVIKKKNSIGYVPAIPKEKMDMSKIVELFFGPRPLFEHPKAAKAYEAAKAKMAESFLAELPSMNICKTATDEGR